MGFEESDLAHVALVGGPGANLGQLSRVAGISAHAPIRQAMEGLAARRSPSGGAVLPPYGATTGVSVIVSVVVLQP